MFRSFFQAGFECSTHAYANGTRLDLLKSTRHEALAREDYGRVAEFGMRTIRTAARWHLIESIPGHYDFASLDVILDAAADTGMEVLLDLLHFGWPDHIDVFSPEFVRSFSRFTRATARHLKSRPEQYQFIAPVNEISYLSWAGADVANINPSTIGRGPEFKRNLVRAAAASSEILLNEMPGVRLICPEPVIHIVGDPEIPGDEAEATAYTAAQFEAWDMMSGRLAPELGGRPEYLDIIGVNYYARNEWVHNSGPLPRTDPRFRHFHLILQEVWDRYRRPMFVAETGTEDAERADWFSYVCDEVFKAISMGIPVHGICLYPILNHPGWADNRHCHNGLFDYADEEGNREIHWPLAHALLEQQKKLRPSNSSTHDSQQHRFNLPVAPPVGLRLPASPASDESFCP
jgi:beta-glucosidase/6-phospho-beta-glucosidase/beta-galactosidase